MNERNEERFRSTMTRDRKRESHEPSRQPKKNSIKTPEEKKKKICQQRIVSHVSLDQYVSFSTLSQRISSQYRIGKQTKASKMTDHLTETAENVRIRQISFVARECARKEDFDDLEPEQKFGNEFSVIQIPISCSIRSSMTLLGRIIY